MADRMTIPLIRDPRFAAGDEVVLSVDGQEQPDPALIWDEPTRSRLGWGQGGGGWGHGADGLETDAPGSGAVGWGTGAWGYGDGAADFEVLEHQTRTRFAAADYAVSGKVRELNGNVGAPGSGVIVEHRPIPGAPRGVSIDPGSGVISWRWSE